uniref:NADH dehydrogenase [ubiquinone] 1 beta subcomplex subunit 4 n=1 Tax=Oryza meridionalis TaxID=40149 RepID=A0A0E0C7G4_9ORYZ
MARSGPELFAAQANPPQLRALHQPAASRGGGEEEKMGGGMEVHKNRWIEEWNAGRENLEFNFRWTRRSLAVVGLFGLAVPILVYKGIVREFHMQDEDAGRPPRKFL